MLELDQINEIILLYLLVLAGLNGIKKTQLYNNRRGFKVWI